MTRIERNLLSRMRSRCNHFEDNVAVRLQHVASRGMRSWGRCLDERQDASVRARFGLGTDGEVRFRARCVRCLAEILKTDTADVLRILAGAFERMNLEVPIDLVPERKRGVWG